jgi:membrane fusion protein (multidrug efflux system)
MAKKIILTIVMLIVVVGSLVGIKIDQFKTMFAQQAHAAAPPESVASSIVQKQTLRPTLEAVGSVTAVHGVTLTAEVAGTIRRIAFESGTSVKTGEVLVELDTTVEKAQLESADANRSLMQSNLDSSRDLIKSGAISRTQYITLEAQAKQADAEVARLQAIINKKTIRAPFEGHTGLRAVNLGQFVGNGDAIVSLQSLDPVYVDFALPQQRLADLHVGEQVQVSTDAFPDQHFAGAISAIHPEVDASTRSIRLRATLKNPGDKLRPGMFAKAEVSLPGEQEVLVVPATAIMYAPYGDSVFVIEKSKDGKQLTARQKFVRLGAARGDFVVVTDGLSSGEDVITTGAFKLRNGVPVLINNDLKPEPSNTPKPTDT